MRLIGFLHRKPKPQGVERLSNHAECFSDELLSGVSSSSQSASSTSPRIELHRPAVDDLFEKEHLQLIEAFSVIDKDGDGKISKKELKAMWKVLGEKITDKELRFMVQEADANGDGAVDLGEFYILSRDVGLGVDDTPKQEEIQVAFRVADANRDGHISATELQKVMSTLHKKTVSIGKSSAMVKWVDSDGDNEVNYQEFERLMTSSILSSSTS